MIMFGLSEFERICAGVLLFAYTYITFPDPVITRGGWEHITRFKPATLFVPYLSQDLYFRKIIFLLNEFRGEDVIGFVGY